MSNDSSMPKGERRAKCSVHRHVHCGVHPNGQPNLRVSRRMRTKRWFTFYAAKSLNWAGATPLFDTRCVTIAVWSLPPSIGTSGPRFARLHTQAREFVRQNV
jgi:hypothetical protein